MYKRFAVIFAVLLLAFVAGVLPASHHRAIAEESNLNVSITEESIAPSEAEVKPGTTVIWFNNTEQSIRVRFLSKAISTTCKSPRNFEIGSKGIYVSSELSKGEFASLCFLEKHAYDYQVELEQPKDSDASSDMQVSSVALKGLIKVGQ